MRKLLCLAMMLPLVAVAGIRPDLLRSRAVLYTGQETGNAAAVRSPMPSGPRIPLDVVGRVDTVGGTTYDIEGNGPQEQSIVYDPVYGIHVAWIYSNDLTNPPSFPDRNMRYNFYSESTLSWNWIDQTNFMNSGTNAFTIRSGFGMMDYDPVTGAGLIDAHNLNGSSVIKLDVVADAAPGAGIWNECDGDPTTDGYEWPGMGVTSSEKVHFTCMDASSHLWYTKVDPWCTWAIPSSVPDDSSTDAGFPDYNIAVSKQTPTVTLLWAHMNANPATEPMTGWMKTSTDDGATWEPETQIPFPNVFTPSTETMPSFDISSLSGYYDANDNLHIIAQVVPFISSQEYVLPAVLCHWTAANGWSVIYRASTDTLAGSVESNCTYACRGTLTFGPTPMSLVCVWDQFDSLNADPTTSILRADVLAARSENGGMTWGAPVRVATGGSASLIFPCAAHKMAGDSVHIFYMADQNAGSTIPSNQVGVPTNNPMLHQVFSRLDLPVGIEEGKTLPPASMMLGAAAPNPFRSEVRFAYALPRAGEVKLVVRDVTGRPIKTLVNGQVNPGSYTATWNGRAENGAKVASGVYFYTLTADKTTLTRKLTLLQ